MLKGPAQGELRGLVRRDVLHVLTRASTLLWTLLRRGPGLALVAVVGSVVGAGLVLATLTLPAADHLQDATSAHVDVDGC
jgi:hypothetical protein